MISTFFPYQAKVRAITDVRARRGDAAHKNDCLHQDPNILPNILRVTLCLRRILAQAINIFFFDLNQSHYTEHSLDNFEAFPKIRHLQYKNPG